MNRRQLYARISVVVVVTLLDAAARAVAASPGARQAVDRSQPAPPGASDAVRGVQLGPVRIAGIVVDASGAPVPGAVVTADVSGTQTLETTTGADGRFLLSGVSGTEVQIRASAPGFDEARLRLAVGGEHDVRVVLYPARLHDVVTVTASRGAARLDTPAATTVLTSSELLNSAGPMIDDALRNTPGFSLFRRSSSRVSVPSAQGATLRGISGSGASRTLVLADGLPLNDPFGSWVYWNRVPAAAIDRVEIVRGAAGDLYGADALGGVIQVLTFSPTRSRLRAFIEGASYETARASVFAATRARGWTLAGAGEWSDTAGVVRIAPEARGPIDTPVTSDYRTGFATTGYDAGPWRIQARVGVYDEDRSRGTPLTVDDTSWRQASGEAAGTAAGGAWLVRVAAGSQSFFNNFSAVSADRRTERLTRDQRVPATFAVLSGQWVREWSGRTLLLGAEARRTRATVYETRYSLQGVPSGPFLAGGVETDGAFFARISVRPADRITVVAGARGDVWRSRPHDAAVPRHAVSFFSPSASLAWQTTSAVGLRVAASRAYRTPTLNELHRGFRVGDVVTDPNPQLDPERLTAIEGGVLLVRRGVSARVTGFFSHLDDAVANVTVQATPTLITRQKQNADQVRAAGVEAELDVRPTPRLTVTGLAVFTSSQFSHTPKQPALEGKRVPQVPRYQVGASLTYAAPRLLTTSAQIRVIGAQFDDDLNQFELRAFSVVDWSASRALARQAHAFVAVENLFDVEYDVGRTPIRTVGWPRTIRAGLRLFLP